MPAPRFTRFPLVAAAVALPCTGLAHTPADVPAVLAPITVSASALDRPLARMTQPAVVLDEDALIERRGAMPSATLNKRNA